MRCTVMMLVICAALATPLVASADDQTISPEAHWTPTPPARSTVDVHQLASLLVNTGMITPHESTQLPPHRRLHPPSTAAPGRGPGTKLITIVSGVQVVIERGC
jgi:hypothetical protein